MQLLGLQGANDVGVGGHLIRKQRLAPSRMTGSTT
jgi:hypothetical protein